MGLQQCCTCNMNKNSKLARVPYLGLMFIMTIIAIVFRYAAPTFFDWLKVYTMDDCNGSDRCMGNESVYRICFTLFIFFLFHAITMCVKGCGDFIAMCWMAKVMTFIAALIGMFFIPNDFFDVFAEISRVLSGQCGCEGD